MDLIEWREFYEDFMSCVPHQRSCNGVHHASWDEIWDAVQEYRDTVYPDYD